MTEEVLVSRWWMARGHREEEWRPWAPLAGLSGELVSDCCWQGGW